MSLRHVLRAQQFDRPLLEQLFGRADALRALLDDPVGRRELADSCKGHLLFNVFYEPSTRTRMSFAAAAELLGLQVVSTENAREFSSAAKGETLEDTVRVLTEYRPSVMVFRHFETGAVARASEVSNVPLINAGDGRGQHPTQALLDLYTIQRERGGVDDCTVLIGGDLANGRTARSLAYLLSKFTGVKLVFAAPAGLEVGNDLKQHLGEHGVPFTETDDVSAALPEADVVYWTRLQKERLEQELADDVWPRFVLDERSLTLLRPDAVVMHPLPRIDEITPAVDADKRAAYFRQAGNGLYVRMALIEWVLGRDLG